MRKKMVVALAGSLAVVGLLAACGGASSSTSGSAGTGGGSKPITLGFAQVGAESGWRSANTKSIQESAKAAGITLKFSDAQQKQANQIQAIRSYIQQKVDVIAFSPVVESGWDPVLNEAKAAKIPVILTDRAVDSKDTTLYKSFLGSDFVKEGNSAGEWLVKDSAGKPTNVVEITGTTGSAPAIDRGTGFRKAIAGSSNIKIIASQTGDFTRAGGKQVMEAFLKAHPKDINVLFAHNDDEGLGALEAIKAAGLTPGKDIKIITIDATHDGLQALANGEFNYVVECNPLLGPQLMDLAKQVVAGQTVPTRVETKETVFDTAAAKAALPTRQY